MISGLSINLQKSTIHGIEGDLAIALQIVAELQCRFGSLSFNYLGIPRSGL